MPETTAIDDSIPIRITPDLLGERYATGRRWWVERMPELVAAGVASKVGRHYFAKLADVDDWIARGGPGTTTAEGKSAANV